MSRYLNDYKWVLIFAALVALAAGFFAWRQDKYGVSLSLAVVKAGAPNTADYQYDSYYALKASDEFSNAVAGWFKTPEMAQIIEKQAGLETGRASLAGLSRRFQAVKISPTTVEVRFGATGEEAAKNMSEAIADAAASKAELLNASSNHGVAFAVISGEPVIVSNSDNIWRNILLGLIIGLVFGGFLKVAVEYFKTSG